MSGKSNSPMDLLPVPVFQSVGKDKAAQATKKPNLIHSACRSVTGLRDVNQDRVDCGYFMLMDGTRVHYLDLCDGMGGHSGGEIAAAIALQTAHSAIHTQLMSDLPFNETRIPDIIRMAIEEAHQSVTAHALENQELADMGTTLVVAILIGDTSYVGSVGDSRAYLIRNARPIQITRDDSLVQDMVDQGVITPEEAPNHPMNNVITRCLGGEGALGEIAVVSCRLSPGDYLLVNSDGVVEEALTSVARAFNVDCNSSPAFLDRSLCSLLNLSIDLGSTDNVSAALLSYGDCESSHRNAETKRYW